MRAKKKRWNIYTPRVYHSVRIHIWLYIYVAGRVGELEQQKKNIAWHLNEIFLYVAAAGECEYLEVRAHKKI